MTNDNFNPAESGITWEEWQKLLLIGRCEALIEQDKLFTWEWITAPGLEDLCKNDKK